MFHVSPNLTSISNPIEADFYLIIDNWDDWFTFNTQYSLFYYTKDEWKSIGSVKIGQIGLGKIDEDQPETDENRNRRPQLPNEFEQLDKNFFSLGQSEDYYLYLGSNKSLRIILSKLNDCAYNIQLNETFKDERVYYDSLRRFIDQTKLDLFKELAQGNEKPKDYNYSFKYPENIIVEYPQDSDSINFLVRAKSKPPTNINAIIGSNGVGKTYLLSLIMQQLYEKAKHLNILQSLPFTKVIFVSFSNFDAPPQHYKTIRLKFEYVGYTSKEEDIQNNKHEESENNQVVNTDIQNDDLASRFANSIYTINMMECCKERWNNIMRNLEYDPLLNECNKKLNFVLEKNNKETIINESKNIFCSLSSGHSIILLIFSRLVELVERRTLILIDEPESHLHPPLLSAFIRSLSWLMQTRSAMSIVVTHSPIVLQEIPREATWIINRINAKTIITKPKIETFGENIGLIMNDIFKFEINRTGYINLLKEEITKAKDDLEVEELNSIKRKIIKDSSIEEELDKDELKKLKDELNKEGISKNELIYILILYRFHKALGEEAKSILFNLIMSE